MERRKQTRHRLAADAAFAWEGPRNTPSQGGGITRDISLSGAFIFSLTCPAVAETIQVDILLLPLGGGSRTLRLKTGATVLRVEHLTDGEKDGFAVALHGLGLAEGNNDLGVQQ